MTETIVLLVFLATCVASIWLVAKKYGQTKEQLKNERENKEDAQNENLLVSAYINMSSQQLLDRVRKKREAAQKRMRTEDRLD